MIRKTFIVDESENSFFLETYFSHVSFLYASYKEMKRKAVYLGHSRFVSCKKKKKKKKKIDIFSYFSMKTYVVGTHNICFHGEIKNII